MSFAKYASLFVSSFVAVSALAGCAAEPVDAWLAKGGELAATEGRRCLCNGLLATIGLPQLDSNGDRERPLVTSGEDLVALDAFLGGRERYRAGDVIDWLLGASGVTIAG